MLEHHRRCVGGVSALDAAPVPRDRERCEHRQDPDHPHHRLDHRFGTGPPSISPRAASITDVTGLTLTNACSHPGIVSTGTNAELANVSGRMIMNPSVFTDSVVRAVMPDERHRPAQRQPERRSTSANAPIAPATPPLEPEPEHHARIPS